MRRLIINIVLFGIVLEAVARIDLKVLIAGAALVLAAVLFTGLILDGGQTR
jgi:hypothetical protein